MEVVLIENGVEERTEAILGARGYLVGKFSEDRTIATEFPNLLKKDRKKDAPAPPKVTTGSSESESDSSGDVKPKKAMKKAKKKAMKKDKVAKPKGIFKRPAGATSKKQAVLNSFLSNRWF